MVKWETILSTQKVTIDMGILSSGEYAVRVFLDRHEPQDPMTWKPSYARNTETRYAANEVPRLLKRIIDSIPEFESYQKSILLREPE